MTKTKANALLDAFLAAKAAGQEELWRAAHPEAPDGATVLAIWLMTSLDNMDAGNIEHALKAVDKKCLIRISIYMAIIAHPRWADPSNRATIKYPTAPGDAIRAAIAYYNDPTEYNRAAAENAAWAAHSAGTSAYALDAYTVPVVSDAAYAAARAAWAAARGTEIGDAAHSAVNAAWAVSRDAHNALSGWEIVVCAMVAAIADHYEGRPLVMP